MIAVVRIQEHHNIRLVCDGLRFEVGNAFQAGTAVTFAIFGLYGSSTALCYFCRAIGAGVVADDDFADHVIRHILQDQPNGSLLIVRRYDHIDVHPQIIRLQK